MKTPSNSPANGELPDAHEPEPTLADLYAGIRPEVAALMAASRRREQAIWAEVERAEAEFNRPRGIMGKLFGLRTSVG
jgi:hypothetical protein